MRLNPDGSWGYAVPPFYDDSTHAHATGGLSASNGDTPAKDCSLAIDAQNNLYLAWTEESFIDGPRDIQAYRSTGPQTWERVGAPLSAFDAFTYAAQPRIQTTPSGKIFITWVEFDGNADPIHQNLFASHWDNQTWKTLTNQNGINDGQKSSTCPMLAIDSHERPVVTWQESRSIGDDFAGEYVYVRRHNN